jgi:hypothetical protein
MAEFMAGIGRLKVSAMVISRYEVTDQSLLF